MKTLDQIAAELQGYDPNALPADAVDEFLSRLVEPVAQTERVGLFDALDRVLAADLIAPLSVPPHDNSAMDGYAFAGAQLQAGQGLALRVVGTAYAGAAWQGELGPGQCVKIMTGAVMPAGLDTVVPLELTRVEGEWVQVPADALRAGDLVIGRRVKMIHPRSVRHLPVPAHKGQQVHNPSRLALQFEINFRRGQEYPANAERAILGRRLRMRACVRPRPLLFAEAAPIHPLWFPLSVAPRLRPQ